MSGIDGDVLEESAPGADTAKARARRELDAMDTSALREAVNWFVLLGGTSNVIMQLAMQPVGYGVMESKVTEGSLFGNPKRRARTTMGYIAIAMLGGAEERAAYRAATNRSHARVKSEPGDKVPYKAFDPALQKWVAACLYMGAESAYTLQNGPLEGAFAEEFYRQGMVFGTTLQMPADAWPQSREAFGEYWDKTLDELVIDDAVREYLMRIVRLEYLGRDIPAWLLRIRRRTVAGHLPPVFRDMMGMTWTDEDQRALEKSNRRVAAVQRITPRYLRELPIRRNLRDVQRRLAKGVPLF